MSGTVLVAPTGANGSYVGYASDDTEEQDEIKMARSNAKVASRNFMQEILPNTGTAN